MRLTRVSLVGLFVALVPLAGCSTWRAAEGPPRQVIQDMRESRVRITKPDGTRVVVRSPVIEGDSVVSVLNGFFTCRNIPADSSPEICARMPDLRIEHTSRTSVAALSEVQGVEVRGGSVGRSLGLIGLTLGAAYGLLICAAFC